eukprot:scaffold158_cov105-Cylindrotheca_fusiformis.AAC.10
MSSLSVAEDNNNDLEGGNHLSEALLPKTMTTTTAAAAKTDSPNSKPKQTIAKKKKEKNHKYDSEILERNKRAAIQLMAIWFITLSSLIYNYYFNNNNKNDKTIMNEFSFEIKTSATAPDPLDFTVLFPDDTEDTSMVVARWPDDDNDEAEQVAASSSSLNGPIPPFHPHHTAFVTYSSHMSSKGSVEYRRYIRVPCNYGMLVFSVGLAKDNLPYRYEVYNDAYLFSDNNSLCILNPWYAGYQVSNEPFWNPTDPMSLEVKNLNKNTMHWISSRLVNPYSSKRKYDRQKTGDYIVVAKHNFYDAHYYQALKAAVNQWQ